MEERIYQGYVYRRAGPGEAWQMVGPAQQQAPQEAPARPGGQVFTLPPDPNQQAQDARAAAAAAREDIRFQERNKPSLPAGYMWSQDGRSVVPIPGYKTEGNSTQQAEDRDRVSRLNQLIAQINRVQELYEAGPGSTKGLAGLQDYLPLDRNEAFDTAGASLAQQGLAAFRVPGTGTISDRDAEMFDRANLPSASLRDVKIEEQLRGMRSRVEEEMRALRQPNPMWDGVQNAQAAAPGMQGRMEAAGGATRTEVDPKVAGMVDAMIRGGATTDQINAALKAAGWGAVDAKQVEAAREYLKKYPNATGFAQATREVPQSLLERISASPFASGVVGGFNGLTGGWSDEIWGGVESLLTDKSFDQAVAEIDQAKQAIGQANPLPYFAGNVAGGLLPAAGISKALSGASVLGRAAPAVGDIGFGILSGVGESNDNRILGGALGATGAAVGRGITSGATRLVGRGVGGGGSADVRYLADQGIPLTGGQMMGGALKSLEDRLTSGPLAGDIIGTARGEGIEAMNRAAFRQGAGVDAFGEQGIEAAQQAYGKAYRDALGGVNVLPDAQFSTDFADAVQRGAAIPRTGPEFQYVVDSDLAPHLSQPSLSGESVQDMLERIRKAKSGMTGDAMGGKAADALTDVEGALMDMVTRQFPDTMPKLSEANRMYRNTSILADAVRAGKNTDGVFTPAQLGSASVNNTAKFGGKIAAATTDRPFFELQRAAQNVLPSKIPDSGTAGRVGLLAAPVAIAGGAGLGGGAGYAAGDPGTGAGVGGASTLGLLATAATANTPAGRKALQKLLVDRKPWMRGAGDWIEQNAVVPVGIFGRSLGGTAAIHAGR